MEKIAGLVLNSIVPWIEARGNEGQGATKGATAADLLLDKKAHVFLPKNPVFCWALSCFMPPISVTRDVIGELCERWAGLVIMSFFLRAIWRRNQGLPVSMNCDREKVLVPLPRLAFESLSSETFTNCFPKLFIPEEITFWATLRSTKRSGRRSKSKSRQAESLTPSSSSLPPKRVAGLA